MAAPFGIGRWTDCARSLGDYGQRMADSNETRKKAAEGRRWTITVAGTLLWIAIGNAALHIEPVTVVYGIAVLVAVLLFAAFKPR